jgi:hypothetical protein
MTVYRRTTKRQFTSTNWADEDSSEDKQVHAVRSFLGICLLRLLQVKLFEFTSDNYELSRIF